MARKHTNESNIHVSMDNSGNKNQSDYVTKVKVPFYNYVIVKDNINMDKKAKPVWGYSNAGMSNQFQFTEEEVIDDFKKNGLTIEYFEPVEIRVRDICPNCGLVGRPKFDRRPNDTDYHVRSDNKQTQFPTNRPDDYTLTFSHKIGDKVPKCTIGKLDKNHLLIIKDGKVHEKMMANIFPNFIKAFKNA